MKEKRGDWPEELEIVDETTRWLHDTPEPPSPEDVERQKADEAKERREGHPADEYRIDDPELD